MKKITFLIFLLISSFSFSQVLTEDFEAGLLLPAGWTNNDINSSGEIWTFNTGGEAVGYNPPNTLYYDNGFVGNYALFDSDGYGGAGGAEEAALESPAFDCTSLTLIQLSFNNFFTAGYGGFGYVEVFDGTSWIEVASYTGADQNDSSIGLEEIDVTTELSGVNNAKVRFRWVGDYSWGWAVDNIVVEEGPSCLVPTNLTAGTITPTTFELNWVDGGNSGSPTWEIEYGAEGFTQGSGTTIPSIPSPTYTFMSLTPDTTYDLFIRTNCGGADGDSEWVGPISFTSAYDCSTYGFPFSDDFSNQNAFNSCYAFENVASDATGWGYNNGNDFDGDTVNDPVALVWADADTTVKDDWMFLPVFNGVANADYLFTFTYNAFNNPALAASESFEVVVLDAPSSSATVQSVLGTYTNVTQNGAGVGDLIPNAYSDNVTYTPTADGDFYFGIRATTPSGNSGILLFFTLDVTQTLGVSDFESNAFTHFYNGDTKDLIIESSSLPFDSIELYNIMGQNVFSKSLSQTTEAISLSNYNDGIYLAKVSIQGKTKTVKILKH